MFSSILNWLFGKKDKSHKQMCDLILEEEVAQGIFEQV